MSRPRKKSRSVRLTAAAAVCCAVVFCWLGYRAVQRIRMRRPLIDAIEHNDLPAVRTLLDAGADPNARDVPAPSFTMADMWREIAHPHSTSRSTATTALQVAVHNGNLGIVEALVGHGANVNALGESTAQLVIGSDVYMIEFLFQCPAIIDAVILKRTDILRFLLEHGANPNLREAAGITPLRAALLSLYNEPETMDPETKYQQSAAIIDLLLAHHADASARGPNGDTEIMSAAQNDAAAVVPLVTHGADANTRLWSNTTLLMRSIQACPPNELQHTLNILLDHGADPNACDDDGETALSTAAGLTAADDVANPVNVEVVRLLLYRGADPNIRDKRGHTILQRLHMLFSDDKDWHECVEMLQKAVSTSTPLSRSAETILPSRQ